MHAIKMIIMLIVVNYINLYQCVNCYFVKFQEVERELNVNFMRLVEMENPDMLLTNQLRKLMVRLEF